MIRRNNWDASKEFVCLDDENTDLNTTGGDMCHGDHNQRMPIDHLSLTDASSPPKLEKVPVYFYTSPYIRTKQTLFQILDAFSEDELEVRRV